MYVNSILSGYKWYGGPALSLYTYETPDREVPVQVIVLRISGMEYASKVH
jgi:hypothetical protein